MLADFHNHSCLSPCGSLDMSPRVIAEIAAKRNVEILALTDHNSSRNCPAFAFHCKRMGIIPLYGLEVTTQEEVHMLSLFAGLNEALAFGEYIYSIITPFPNKPEIAGDQVYVDKDDNIEGELEFYLSGAAAIGVGELGLKTVEFGGIVIPAHVDRPAFSMSSQLGVVVKGPWAAVECVQIPPYEVMGNITSRLLKTHSFPLIRSSDAHFTEHIGRRSFELDITVEELLPNGMDGDADLKAVLQALKTRPRDRW
ncbi:MAG: PHP domain-containing protein [Treponema sp.]|nr:PHP domain-containing protein [Treponema sp.]